MEIGSLVNATNSAAAKSRTTLAGDFDKFLTLLTTQLSHQDPLNPVDSNQFVSQLVSFTGVEQAVNTNTNLEQLIKLTSLGQTASAIGYLGNTVVATSDAAQLANGSASFAYSLPANTASTGITITDADGNVVFTGSGATAEGQHAFVWDGRSNDGTRQPDGLYRVAVSAVDGDGLAVDASTQISGTVTGLESDASGALTVLVDGAPVPFANIVSVTAPPAP